MRHIKVLQVGSNKMKAPIWLLYLISKGGFEAIKNTNVLIYLMGHYEFPVPVLSQKNTVLEQNLNCSLATLFSQNKNGRDP